jgi:phage antirepressor YoqD-like protein
MRARLAQPADESPALLVARALIAANGMLEEMRPKAEAFDRWQEAWGTMPMRELAMKLGTGRTRLFRMLRAAGIVPHGSTIPYQRYIDEGYFKLVSKTQELTDGTARTDEAAQATSRCVPWLAKRLGCEVQA